MNLHGQLLQQLRWCLTRRRMQWPTLEAPAIRLSKKGVEGGDAILIPLLDILANPPFTLSDVCETVVERFWNMQDQHSWESQRNAGSSFHPSASGHSTAMSQRSEFVCRAVEPSRRTGARRWSPQRGRGSRSAMVRSCRNIGGFPVTVLARRSL